MRKKSGQKAHWGITLVVCALALGLCACQNSGQSNSGQGDSGAENSAASVSDAGTLQMLEPGNEHGRYVSAAQNGNELLCWIDYDTAQEIPLCAAPNCEHNGEECTACITGDGLYVGGQVAALGEDQLLFTVKDNHHQQPGTLYCANKDGSNRHKLAQMTMEDDLRGVPFCVDQQFLYMMLLHMSGESQYLARVPREGGEVEILLAPAENNLSIPWVHDRRMLIQEYDYEQDKTTAYTYQVDTKEKKPLDVPWLGMNQGFTMQLAGEDRLYQSGPDGVRWVNMDGETGLIPIQWPQEIQQEIEKEAEKDYAQLQYRLDGIVDSKLLVTINGLDTEKSGPGARRFILDPQTGEMQESLLHYMKDWREIPVSILAQSKDALLIETESVVEERTYIQPNGVPDTGMKETCRYGLISNEDFLSGTNRWRDISMKYPDHWF